MNAFCSCLGDEQLAGDPDQRQPAEEAQAGNHQQPDHDQVIAARTTIAPTVPQMMAFFRRSAGRERAASAITMALSPARTRSMMTMASSAEKKLRGKEFHVFACAPQNEMPGGKVGAKKNLYRPVKVSRQLALPAAPGLSPVLTATAVKLLPF